MTFEVDEEILQDFLVEAGEILELLSEQLVELENNPNDTELLNAIFRGFHTVKGGAGFLSLTELVQTCHGAENVFDCLRQNNRSVNAVLMDTILAALDVINEQFDAVKSGDTVNAAPAQILEKLHQLSRPASEDKVVTAVIEEVKKPSIETVTISSNNNSSSSIDEITHEKSGDCRTGFFMRYWMNCMKNPVRQSPLPRRHRKVQISVKMNLNPYLMSCMVSVNIQWPPPVK